MNIKHIALLSLLLVTHIAHTTHTNIIEKLDQQRHNVLNAELTIEQLEQEQSEACVVSKAYEIYDQEYKELNEIADEFKVHALKQLLYFVAKDLPTSKKSHLEGFSIQQSNLNNRNFKKNYISILNEALSQSIYLIDEKKLTIACLLLSIQEANNFNY